MSIEMKKLALITISIIIFCFLTMSDGNAASVKEQIRFGALMAKKGNWREAMFRWEKVLKKEPENYRLHNNMAVAYEALGEYENAEKAYQMALKYGKNNKRVQENYNLFKKFYSSYKRDKKKHDEKDQGDHPQPNSANSLPPIG